MLAGMLMALRHFCDSTNMAVAEGVKCPSFFSHFLECLECVNSALIIVSALCTLTHSTLISIYYRSMRLGTNLRLLDS